MERRSRLVSLGAVMALVWALAATASGQATTTVVMTELDNPRGLAFGPEGALYVAEAGRGGDQPCVVVRAGQPVPVFAGRTGAVSRLWHGQQERVATGLPSFTENAPGAPGATGPHDVTFLGRGNARVSVGLGGEPTFRESCETIGPGFGQLVKMPASGKWRNWVDIAAHEEEENPDGGAVDTNPYGLLARPGATFVTDAGGNALLRVAADRSISTVAVFPSRSTGRVPSTDAVPTTVVRGPDGAYYVGELTGAPFFVGEANVYRVVPGEAPTVFLDGFTPPSSTSPSPRTARSGSCSSRPGRAWPLLARSSALPPTARARRSPAPGCSRPRRSLWGRTARPTSRTAASSRARVLSRATVTCCGSCPEARWRAGA